MLPSTQLEIGTQTGAFFSAAKARPAEYTVEVPANRTHAHAKRNEVGKDAPPVSRGSAMAFFQRSSQSPLRLRPLQLRETTIKTSQAVGGPAVHVNFS